MAARFCRGFFNLGKTLKDSPLGRRPIQEAARFLATSSKKTEGKYITQGFDFKHPSFADLYGQAVPKGADELPEFVDWSKIPGALWPVQNQGFSGTCYIFSPLGSMVSVNFIKRGETIELSPQHVFDCHTSTGAGDNGGDPAKVLEFAVNAGGVLPSSVYPFTGYRGICQEVKARGISIDGWKLVNPFDESALKYAVSFQPVVVNIRTRGLKFGSYIGDDVLYGPASWKLDHSVLLIGYDKNDKGEPRWKLLNSYGKYWGDQGLFYVARETGQKAGALGILREPVVPLKWSVKKSSNKVVVAKCDSCPRCWRPKVTTSS